MGDGRGGTIYRDLHFVTETVEGVGFCSRMMAGLLGVMSCLGNPMDRGAWRDRVHGVAKKSDTTLRLNNNNV